ncbi:hypothetical protein QBC39DRAFT_433828 [Podospora conica]|nr:hypothetical protein QBC39DRAFT_433828 [Schizothecium conicum]
MSAEKDAELKGKATKSKVADGKAPKDKTPFNPANPRKWTTFELETVVSLICKGFHKSKGGAQSFATALNKALNGNKRENLTHDIDVEDVALMLEFVNKEKKDFLALIDRQPTQRISRVAKQAFFRNLPRDRTFKRNSEREKKSPKSLEPASSPILVHTTRTANENTPRPTPGVTPHPAPSHPAPSHSNFAPSNLRYAGLYSPRPSPEPNQGHGALSVPIGQPQQPHSMAAPMAIPYAVPPPFYGDYLSNANYHHHAGNATVASYHHPGATTYRQPSGYPMSHMPYNATGPTFPASSHAMPPGPGPAGYGGNGMTHPTPGYMHGGYMHGGYMHGANTYHPTPGYGNVMNQFSAPAYPPAGPAYPPAGPSYPPAGPTFPPGRNAMHPGPGHGNRWTPSYGTNIDRHPAPAHPQPGPMSHGGNGISQPPPRHGTTANPSAVPYMWYGTGTGISQSAPWHGTTATQPAAPQYHGSRGDTQGPGRWSSQGGGGNRDREMAYPGYY